MLNCVLFKTGGNKIVCGVRTNNKWNENIFYLDKPYLEAQSFLKNSHLFFVFGTYAENGEDISIDFDPKNAFEDKSLNLKECYEKGELFNKIEDAYSTLG